MRVFSADTPALAGGGGSLPGPGDRRKALGKTPPEAQRTMKRGRSGPSESSGGPQLESARSQDPSGCDTDSAMEVDVPGMACADACGVGGRTTEDHALESQCAPDFGVPAGDSDPDGLSVEVAARGEAAGADCAASVEPESDEMQGEPCRFGAHIPNTGCICQGCFANVVTV